MKKTLLFTLLVSMMLAACTKDVEPTTTIEIPEGAKLEQTIYADQTSVQDIQFTATEPWTATVTYGEPTMAKEDTVGSWLKLGATSGPSGNATVTAEVATNFSNQMRQCTVKIATIKNTLKFYFTQYEKKENGETPMRYVKKFRMEKKPTFDTPPTIIEDVLFEYNDNKQISEVTQTITMIYDGGTEEYSTSTNFVYSDKKITATRRPTGGSTQSDQVEIFLNEQGNAEQTVTKVGMGDDVEITTNQYTYDKDNYLIKMVSVKSSPLNETSYLPITYMSTIEKGNRTKIAVEGTKLSDELSYLETSLLRQNCNLDQAIRFVECELHSAFYNDYTGLIGVAGRPNLNRSVSYRQLDGNEIINSKKIEYTLDMDGFIQASEVESHTDKSKVVYKVEYVK